MIGGGGNDAMRVEWRRRYSSDGKSGRDSDIDCGGTGFAWWQRRHGGDNGGSVDGMETGKAAATATAAVRY